MRINSMLEDINKIKKLVIYPRFTMWAEVGAKTRLSRINNEKSFQASKNYNNERCVISRVNFNKEGHNFYYDNGC